jgi:hypothetical protein
MRDREVQMKIFISCRRDDSFSSARLLYDELVKNFEADEVFMDIENIGYGDDFVQKIDADLDRADVVMVVIGPLWSEIMQSRQREDDWVRYEIARALQLRAAQSVDKNSRLRVLPILVRGAVPPTGALPADIADLERLSMLTFDERALHADLNILIETLSMRALGASSKELGRRTRGGVLFDAASILLRKAAGGLRDLVKKHPDNHKEVGGKAWPGTSAGHDEPQSTQGPPANATSDNPAVVRQKDAPRFPIDDPFALPDVPRAVILPTPRTSPTTEPLPLPVAVPEPVLIGAAAPQTVRAGDEFTVRFVAYVAALEDQVREEIRDLSPSATSHLGLKICQWLFGTKLKVALRARQLNIRPGEQEFVWEGSRNLIEFDVAAPHDAKTGTVVLKFDVSMDGIVVAALRFDLQIAAAHTNINAASDSVSTIYGSAAQTAFASYALEDQLRVLDRVAAVRISTGLDVFLDCMSLHPGKEWEPQLERQIKTRDLFLLFWSAAAGNSPWVTWEWRTALRERGKDAMQIHPLEIDAKPPEELKDLHFGDVYMFVRQGRIGSTTPTSISD